MNVHHIVSFQAKDNTVEISMINGNSYFHKCKDNERAVRWRDGIVKRLEELEQ